MPEPGPSLSAVIVGCGDISRWYAEGLAAHRIALSGAFDVDPERLAAFCSRWSCPAYESLDAVLDDASVSAVVNLTPPRAHFDVTRRCLAAGKHVHSEKPLAMTLHECEVLIQTARDAGVQLSASPFTHMGHAQRTLRRLIHTGHCGDVRMVYAEVNQGRIERRHPAPEATYAVGPLWDVGVYSLTILTACLGPVRRVSAVSRRLLPQRSRLDGTPFQAGAYDWIAAVLDLSSGASARLTCSFYVGAGWRRTMQFHGDAATLQLDSFLDFASPLTSTAAGGEASPVAVEGGHPGADWSWPMVELRQALAEGRPNRLPADHAAHVVETMCAIDEAAATGVEVAVRSAFQPLPASC